MWYPASITSIDKITNQTWKFVIEPNEKFDFIPGQFIQLKIGETKRSYSIASYDPNNNFFELLINVFFTIIQVIKKIIDHSK